MVTDWDPDDMAKCAYHEAGHAIVAWSFNLVVQRVYLDVGENSGGTETDPLPDDVKLRVAIRADSGHVRA